MPQDAYILSTYQVEFLAAASRIASGMITRGYGSTASETMRDMLAKEAVLAVRAIADEVQRTVRS